MNSNMLLVLLFVVAVSQAGQAIPVSSSERQDTVCHDSEHPLLYKRQPPPNNQTSDAVDFAQNSERLVTDLTQLITEGRALVSDKPNQPLHVVKLIQEGLKVGQDLGGLWGDIRRACVALADWIEKRKLNRNGTQVVANTTSQNSIAGGMAFGENATTVNTTRGNTNNTITAPEECVPKYSDNFVIAMFQKVLHIKPGC
ncbi:hypothetical protein SeLEV6574_g08050 [Synchytrium endobioticum]|nr:hypothetical protein SeLEV6574_g08050 [Synchytrium endobioticum]